MANANVRVEVHFKDANGKLLPHLGPQQFNVSVALVSNPPLGELRLDPATVHTVLNSNGKYRGAATGCEVYGYALLDKEFNAGIIS